MKTLLKIFFTLFILQFTVCISVFAQNLVPNPSFEEYISCPDDHDQLFLATPWFNPTQATPDFYNECYTTVYNYSVDVPQNWIGYQYAETGQGYAGISVYPVSNPPSYREYIAIKLSDSLQAGTMYYVSFYVSLADSVWYATDDIGAYFSTDSIYTTSYYINLPFTPQIANTQGEILNDKDNWKQISGEFIAQGGEQYMVIGNFKNDANTDTISVQNGGDTSYFETAIYYYVDNICISDNPDTCNVVTFIKETCLKNSFILYPNPVKDKLYIKTNKSYEALKLFIYDYVGRNLLYKEKKYKKEFEIDVSNISNGFYILKIILDDKIIINQKLIILKNRR
jgi:hypothetical protein